MKDLGRFFWFGLGLGLGIAGTLFQNTAPQPLLAFSDRQDDYIMTTGLVMVGPVFTNPNAIGYGINGQSGGMGGGGMGGGGMGGGMGGGGMSGKGGGGASGQSSFGKMFSKSGGSTNPGGTNGGGAGGGAGMGGGGMGGGGMGGGGMGGGGNGGVTITNPVTLGSYDGVWLLDYRAGKLLGTVVNSYTGKTADWAEVDLVKEFNLAPKQIVHFMMTTGTTINGRTPLYLAETVSGRFGVYAMVPPQNAQKDVDIRRFDSNKFR